MICAGAFCIFLSAVASDGDTFNVQSGWTHRFRLFGVQAPENHKPGDEASTAALQALLDGSVTCRLAQRAPSFARDVVQCWTAEGLDVSCEMVRQGHAVDWPAYSRGRYAGC